MTQRSFADYGYELLEWGMDDNGRLDEKIQASTQKDRTYFLLAAVVTELQKLRNETRTMRYLIASLLEQADERNGIHECLADGKLVWLHGMNGGQPISQLNTSGLSMRARSALSVGRIKFLGEITEERMLSVRGCGMATVNELLEWKKNGAAQ